MKSLVRRFHDNVGRLPTLAEIRGYDWDDSHPDTVKREHNKQCEIYREIIEAHKSTQRYWYKDVSVAFLLGAALAFGITGLLFVI